MARMPSWRLDLALGVPCLAAAVASRALFADPDTWPHIGLQAVGLALLAGYTLSTIAALFRSRL